jgi:hypothetical protein
MHEDLRKSRYLKDRPAVPVYTRNLTVEHGILGLQMFGDPGCEFSESAEHIPVAGNQFAFAITDVC